MKKQLLLSCMALGLSTASFAQGYVTTAGVKNVLVEESTGAWCQYCPDGAVMLQQLIESNSKVIGVSIHGGGTDKMRFADGDAITSAYFTAFPLGMVDRTPFGSPAAVTGNRGNWASAAATRAAVTPDFDVSLLHGYEAATMTITATVTAKALKAVSGSYNINVYVIEDSCTGTGSGWNQVNYYNTQAGHPYFGKGNPVVGFNHMHVVRAMLGGPFGTTGVIMNNPPANYKVSKTYTYVLPTGSNYKHFKLVAMVEKDNTDQNLRPIMNAVEAKVINAKLAVGSVTALEAMEVYPNPASGNIRVTGTFQSSADLQLTLTNTLGQTVISKTVRNNGTAVCDETLNVSALSNGIYFLNLRSEEGQSSVKVMVSH